MGDARAAKGVRRRYDMVHRMREHAHASGIRQGPGGSVVRPRLLLRVWDAVIVVAGAVGAAGACDKGPPMACMAPMHADGACCGGCALSWLGRRRHFYGGALGVAGFGPAASG